MIKFGFSMKNSKRIQLIKEILKNLFAKYGKNIR